MNAKDLQIEYQLTWESPQVEQARRVALSSVLRMAISSGGSAMKVFQPSNFLKSEDLEGQDWVVTIKDVTKDTIKDRSGAEKDKFVVHFNECKPLILNKVNMTTIISVLGTNESEQWVGKKIGLTTREVEYDGKMVEAIRVKTKAPM